MMASLTVSWVWYFVILTGASNGYPINKASDPRRANKVNSSSGSNWEVPASGFVQAESGSTAASNPIVHSAPHEQPRYTQPIAKMSPAPAVYSSNTFAAPVYSGYDGGSPASSTKLSFQLHPKKDDRVESSGSLYDGTTSSTLPSSSKPKLLGVSNASPQGASLFHPGEASYRTKMYDLGSYESETEEVPPFQYTPFDTMNRFPVGSMLRFGPFVDGFWFGHPYIDRVLLTRKYPLGTYRFSSNVFEHGKNHRHDTIIVDDPTDPSTLQSETFPGGIKQPSHSVRSGNTGYGLGGDVTG